MILLVPLFDLITVGFVVAGDASQYELPEQNAIIMQNVQRQYEETTFESIAPGRRSGSTTLIRPAWSDLTLERP
jgi:hypothetical protein